MAATAPSVHPERRATVRTAGWRWSKFQWGRAPEWVIAGHSTTVMATIPAVVPRPRSSSSARSWVTCSMVGWRPATWAKVNSMMMTTTLLSTGAMAGTAKRRRALSRAVPSAVSP